MNCKPGDLAVIVGSSHPANDGLLVEVLKRWVGPGNFQGYRFAGDEPAWVCRSVGRPMITPKWGKEIQFYERPVADAILRPIRPGDVTDEEVRDLYAPKIPEVA
jgi:hypothetical protein